MSVPVSAIVLLGAFLLSLLVNYLLKSIAGGLGLMAVPGKHRGHAQPTPLTGGIAIFIAMVVSLIASHLILEMPLQSILHFLLATTLLLVVGVFDDRYNLPFILRFIAQIIAVMIMVKQGTVLFNLGELFSSETLSLGRYSVLMTVFATVGVINAINMADGLDGLAASEVILVLLVLSWFAFPPTYTLIIATLTGALLGFLLFNVRYQTRRASDQQVTKHARVFMGDAGSTLLGFVLAWLLIAGSQQTPRLFDPIFAVWLLALPLYDTVSVMLIRPLHGRSPFSADKIHCHHHILQRVGSVQKTVWLMLALCALYAGIGVLCRHFSVPQASQTLAFAVCFVAHFIMQWRCTKQKIMHETIV